MSFVLAVNLDIRGFSDWSQDVESVQAATYLAKLYPRLIDRYFSEEWFFKPTGDGLFLVRRFKEPDLAALAEETIRSCVEIVQKFESFCIGEPLLNFALPSEVGIGIAQGAASRLYAGDKTLDYSGSSLNLASRLMDLARPRGVVFDGGVAAGLLPETLTDQFQTADVYLPGVAPREPITVYYLTGETVISETNLAPIGEIQWGDPITASLTVKELEAPVTARRFFDLPTKPKDPPQLKCTVARPAVDKSGHKIPETLTYSEVPVVYHDDPSGPQVSVDYHAIAESLRKNGAKGPWEVRIRIDYAV